MGNQKVDLTFMSSKELIDELAKRNDALVVLGMRFETNSKYAVTRYFQGNRFVCLGLLANEESRINNIENEQLENDD